MVTPNNYNYRGRYYRINMLVLVFAWFPASTLAQISVFESSHTTPDTKLSDKALPRPVQEQIRQIKARLERLASPHHKQRGSYKIGVIYFKHKMFQSALPYFKEAAKPIAGVEQLNAYALNMVGQTCRFLENRQAMLEAFTTLRKRLAPTLSSSGKPQEWEIRLLSLAAFSNAEAYQMQGDTLKATNEYSVMVKYRDLADYSLAYQKYLGLALDRLSQLYLQQQEVAYYQNCITQLCQYCPNYERKGLVEFEHLCIATLLEQFPELEFPQRSLIAPARLIEEVDKINDAQIESELFTKITDLERAYQATLSGLFIKYHHAWIFDRLGHQEKAISLFREVAKKSRDIGKSKSLLQMGNYAAIQSAILLGEKGYYREALKEIGSIERLKPGSHLWKLKESVGRSLDISRKEELVDSAQ